MTESLLLQLDERPSAVIKKESRYASEELTIATCPWRGAVILVDVALFVHTHQLCIYTREQDEYNE